MVRDAESNAEADKQRRAAVEARNGLDALVHATEKTIRENGDKLPAAEKAEAESAIAAARSAMEGQDVEAITKAQETLSQASMKLGEALYKAQAAQAEAGGGAEGAAGGPGGNPNDKVVDAEFEEVDPTKKKPS
jgi:molecular chaperone DnaK